MIKRVISTLILVLILLSFCSISSSAKEVKNLNFGTGKEIENKINELLEVYDSDSFFTVSGEPCECDEDYDCQLSMIPQRGNLPSGEKAADVCLDSWSCCSFARYVFHYIFNCDPESQIPVSEDELSYGDYIYLGDSHYAIFLGQDDKNFYVYHGNGDGQCGVEYMDALDKENNYFSYGYHAKNYKEVDGNLSNKNNVNDISLSQKDGNVSLNWEKVENVDNYKVLKKSFSSDTWEDLGTTNDNEFTDENAKGINYYSVVSVNSDNEVISQGETHTNFIIINDGNEFLSK